MRKPISFSAFVGLLATLGCVLSAGCYDSVGPEETATLRVSVMVTGLDKDDSFVFSVDSHSEQVALSAGTVVIRALVRGRHEVALSGFNTNCVVSGENPVQIDAQPGAVFELAFHVNCTATSGVIAVSVPLAEGFETTWFAVQIDTAAVQWVRGNRPTFMGVFPQGAHTVRLVDIPRWCQLDGVPSAGVFLRGGGETKDTVVASFDVRCTVVEQDTVNVGIVFQRGSDVALITGNDNIVPILANGMAPAWSPDRKFVVFQRSECTSFGCEGHLWTIRPDRSGERAIPAFSGLLDYDPEVSPDGRSIAFIRFWNGPDQTYLMVSDLDGTSQVVLSIWNPISTPTWSPDGSQIAFTCEGPAPGWELDLCLVKKTAGCSTYFVNLCDGHLPPVVSVISSRFVESEPAWSPDGTRIAFTYECSTTACPPGVTQKESQVALIDLATKAIALIAPGHTPAWSANGQRIVFVGNASDPGLKIIDLDGKAITRITSDPRDANPSWK